MKKRLLILASALLIALLFVSFSVATADPEGPFVCQTDIVYAEHDPVNEPDLWYWYGPISGCELEGNLRYDVNPDYPPVFPGNSYHFFEKFTLYPNSGGEIHGENAGTVQWSNMEFRANGWVTDASPEWEDMIGYKFHEKGTAVMFPDGTITANGTTMRLSPANNLP